MTTEQIASEIAALEIEDYPQLISDIFDAIENSFTSEQVQEINDLLLNEGVDVRGLCRKKHPQS